MTEDEAKTKWCPHARDDANGANRFRYATAADHRADGVDPDYIAETVASYPCIGSACMAWRVRQMSPEQRAAMHRDEGRLHPDLSSDQLWSRVNACDVGDGYCGLAGAPQ